MILIPARKGAEQSKAATVLLVRSCHACKILSIKKH